MDTITLYARDSRSKLREWSICVKSISFDSQALIESSYGVSGGKMITSMRIIHEGKNIGKSNETTPLEQAISEAKSLITKKRQEGYSEHADPTDSADSTDSTEPVSLDYRPMLAHDWTKLKRFPAYPLLTQPKLDGIRMVSYVSRISSSSDADARSSSSSSLMVHMVSRNGKPIYCMNHIEAKIRELYERRDFPDDLVLDGELYSEDLTFEEITSLTRKSVQSRYVKGGETTEDFKQIKYYIFDCFRKEHLDEPFNSRYARLSGLRSTEDSPLQLVPCIPVVNPEDSQETHEDYVSRGFEGTIYRLPYAGYHVNTRSKDLLKRKDFITEEFPIVGAEEGVGRDAGAVIWRCLSAGGNEFLVRPRGSLESRREYFGQSHRYIGKNLTIRYQNLTDSGIPRFPVGLTIRDYE